MKLSCLLSLAILCLSYRQGLTNPPHPDFGHVTEDEFTQKKYAPDGQLEGKLAKSHSHYEARSWRQQAARSTDGIAAMAQHTWKDWQVVNYFVEGHDDFQKMIKEECDVSLTGQYTWAENMLYLHAVLEDRLKENPLRRLTESIR